MIILDWGAATADSWFVIASPVVAVVVVAAVADVVAAICGIDKCQQL